MLIDAFWPEDAGKGRRSLNTAASTLRRLTGSGTDVLTRGPAGLALNPEMPRWHDLEEWDEALTEARRRRTDGQRDAEHDALRRMHLLYRGAYLEGCSMEFAVQAGSRMAVQMVEALGALAAGALECRRPEEALEYSTRAVEIDPLSQDAWQAMLSADLELGRPQDAVRHYEECRRTMARELEAEPAIPLLELYHRARLLL